MAIHVAEMYAALVAQRRQIFAALRQVDDDVLAADVDLEGGSVLGVLARLVHREHETLNRVIQRRPAVTWSEFCATRLGEPLTLAAIEIAWSAVADQFRDYVRLEKPYELVFPRKDLADGLGGTAEQVLWSIILHEMTQLGQLIAARRQHALPLPDLSPMDFLRRNPELGRWWMAEQY